MRFYFIFTVLFMLMLAVSLAQVRRQAHLGRRASWALMALGLAVSLVLASTRFLPEAWPISQARIAWWAGYGCFAVVSYLFLFQVLLLCAELLARCFTPRWAPALRSGKALALVLALTGLVTAYGSLELHQLRVVSHTMRSAKIPRPLRLAVVTDLHLGALCSEARVDAVAGLVAAQKPDLLLLVGDLVNDHPQELRPLAEKLAAVRPGLGTYGVFGNHERYEGDELCAQVFRWSGAALLNNRSLKLAEAGVQLLGVNDPGRDGPAAELIAGEINGLAQELDPRLFRVLLNHRPLAWREAAKPQGIELMLSGHTHRGQMFPLAILVKLINGFLGGFYEEDGFVLGVSGGAGFWGPPLRVFAPADILVVDLLPLDGPRGPEEGQQ